MPTQTTILKVFVASPSEIIEERNIIEKDVDELNKLLGSTVGIRLEILKWETDTYPSIGEDAQSVINEQIDDRYDIFIGILWKRFGTPTKRALSGTEEEFNNAYKRAREKPNSVRVMFYFKDKPVSISKLDPGQIAKIKAFQDSLGDKGVYYWTYKQIGDFSRFVRMHLGLAMNEFGSKWGQEMAAKREPIMQLAVGEHNAQAAGEGASAWTVKSKPEKPVEEDIKTKEPVKPSTLPPGKLIEEVDEEGYLDLIISSVDGFNSGGASLERITEIMKENTKRTKKSTEDLNQLPKPINPNKARFVINQFADDQDYFVKRIKKEIPILSDSFRTGIDKSIRSVELMKDFNIQDKSQIEVALTSITNLKNSINQAIQSTSKFRDTVQALPRMTTKLNHSKKNVVEILDTLIDEYATEESLSIEAEKVFRNTYRGYE